MSDGIRVAGAAELEIRNVASDRAKRADFLACERRAVHELRSRVKAKRSIRGECAAGRVLSAYEPQARSRFQGDRADQCGIVKECCKVRFLPRHNAVNGAGQHLVTPKQYPLARCAFHVRSDHVAAVLGVLAFLVPIVEAGRSIANGVISVHPNELRIRRNLAQVRDGVNAFDRAAVIQLQAVFKDVESGKVFVRRVNRKKTLRPCVLLDANVYDSAIEEHGIIQTPVNVQKLRVRCLHEILPFERVDSR